MLCFFYKQQYGDSTNETTRQSNNNAKFIQDIDRIGKDDLVIIS